MKTVFASVISNREVMPGVHLIWLESPQIASVAQPGQFVMVHCGEGTEYMLRRPLSIHQISDNEKLVLLFAVMGKGTYWLSQCQAGDTLDLLGPLGNSYSIHPTTHNLLLIAGGIGTAPLCFLSQEALKRGLSVTLLLGAQTSNQLYPGNFLPSGINLVAATEDGTAGRKGMVTYLIPDFIDWTDQAFACGPVTMYQDMYTRRKELLKSKSVQVSLEVRMGCGLGACYSCTVKTRGGLRQVCKDGPVFDLEEILWNEPTCV
ncbi:dihydroorotate dehydrogenase electron transfer subunit [Chloroflexota bacterium]